MPFAPYYRRDAVGKIDYFKVDKKKKRKKSEVSINLSC